MKGEKETRRQNGARCLYDSRRQVRRLLELGPWALSLPPYLIDVWHLLAEQRRPVFTLQELNERDGFVTV